MSPSELQKVVADIVGTNITEQSISLGELTIEVPADHITDVATKLRDHHALKFEILIDVTAVDYFSYGTSEWNTDSATSCGFERGVRPVQADNPESKWQKSRFAVVYHLLSITHNHRIRVMSFVPDAEPMIDSVVPIWSSANWYEREVFDLFGIYFNNHPDLRRIMTDYGFVGHPFRKDFPLIGEVACHYDAKQERVVYAPVDIEPRTLVPKVIRTMASDEPDVKESA